MSFLESLAIDLYNCLGLRMYWEQTVLTVYSELTPFKCKSYSLQRHVCKFIVIIVSICGPDKDNAEWLLRHHSVHELVLLEFHYDPSCAIIERHDLNQ